MNDQENAIILKVDRIVDQLLSGKRKFDVDTVDIDSIENEVLKAFAAKVVHLGEQYRDCYRFIMDLSCGKLYTEPPYMNAFANPFKQLHSELRHLTWQIQEIANGDYDQCVSFSGDFADAINKMIIALRERRMLMGRIQENENLFRSIFSTSPDGIVLCDLNHCIINASNAAYRMLQITKEENGKINFNDLIHREDEENYRKFLDSLLNGGSTTAFSELRMVLPSGTSFWSEQNASVLLDLNRNPKGYIIIFRDITERKIAEVQLLQYTDELDESNRAKDMMFSIIAHDLKNPFNALLGSSNVLKQEANSSGISVEKIRKYSNVIHESATKAFDLLLNLLEWSRLQSNKIVVRPEQLNLNDVVIYNVDIGLTMAVNKNITLTYTTPGDYPLVSDLAIINTVLRNVISNAVKYTPQNGRITVFLSQKDSMFFVSVQDNGMGIAREKLEKLFKPGIIQSTPGTASEKGTGLGLALCKDFVNKIGGDIWIESVREQGTTVTFSLRNLPIGL